MKNKAINLSKEQLRLLQLNELEMLVEIDRICKKNDIKYSLDGGTLLGAIRHKGFIPWDDDADVIFTRHEYAKFFRACKNDLDKTRFFLQDYRTDSEYRWGYAKLRRKGTTFTRLGQESQKYRDGVFLDIFVLDNMPDDQLSRYFYKASFVALRKTLYSSVGKENEKNEAKRFLYQVLNFVPKDLCFKYRNFLAKSLKNKNTELVHHYLWPYPGEYSTFGVPSKYFKEYTTAEFEGMEFMVIADYDKYLTRVYGDYMTLPPKEKRISTLELSAVKLVDVNLEDIKKGYLNEKG